MDNWRKVTDRGEREHFKKTATVPLVYNDCQLDRSELEL